MRPEMLQLQQYLNVHPILGKTDGFRKKYVVLLNYFVLKQGRCDLWSKQMLTLYGEKIVCKDFEVGKEYARDLSVLEQFKSFKYFKYRYCLLTDCLFIKCFDNKKNKENQKKRTDV